MRKPNPDGINFEDVLAEELRNVAGRWIGGFLMASQLRLSPLFYRCCMVQSGPWYIFDTTKVRKCVGMCSTRKTEKRTTLAVLVPKSHLENFNGVGPRLLQVTWSLKVIPLLLVRSENLSVCDYYKAVGSLVGDFGEELIVGDLRPASRWESA